MVGLLLKFSCLLYIYLGFLWCHIICYTPRTLLVQMHIQIYTSIAHDVIHHTRSQPQLSTYPPSSTTSHLRLPFALSFQLTALESINRNMRLINHDFVNKPRGRKTDFTI